MDYPGKVITKNQVTPTQTSATGVWTLDDAAAATRNNNWPVAGVPNPISKSLRFNSPDTAYLNRTPGSAPTNADIGTWSFWVKRTKLATEEYIFGSRDGGNVTLTGIRFISTDALEFLMFSGGTALARRITTQVFRDVGAWYHFVVVYNSPSATASERVRIYVNGVEIPSTAFSTSVDPSQNQDLIRWAASGIPNYIGNEGTTLGNYGDYYLTETYYIDGQALTQFSFGMTDPVTGVWEPLKYSGTYGTNGFYLNFKDATSTTTLGYDYSGNANNWTANGFVVTPPTSAGNDSLTDVPTPWVAYNTTGDVGGVVRGNYCTLNPLDEPSTYAAAGSSANGNLDFSVSNDAAMGATFAVSSGKWYWEMTVVSGHSAGANTIWTAITSINPSSSNKLAWQSGSGSRSYATTGLKFNENTSSSYGNTYTNGDVIGCALDLDNGKVYWSKNGTFQASGDPVAGTNAAFTGLTGTWLPEATQNAGVTAWNFGQRPFAYTPPSGFLSLCTTNLEASTVLKGSDYFNPVLYTGNGSTQTITGLDFQPDWTWIKERSSTSDNLVQDAVRGVTKLLETNTTNAEQTATNIITSFNSNGFSLGVSNAANENTQTYVAWNWKANGAGASNTNGSITSTVSANTTSGFSIVTYTGTGANATVGHGCQVGGVATAPSMIIIKGRNTSVSWPVWHSSFGTAGNSDYLLLNTTDQKGYAGGSPNAQNLWNSTTPTSSVFSLGTYAYTNANTTTYVAYCFAPVAGYSAFGGYTGNGSSTDGVFIYLGFRPRYVLIKRTNTTENWHVMDTARNSYNAMDASLYPNLANSEVPTSGHAIDFLSNGIKMRNNNTGYNASSSTYIYAAFAESPFKYALAR